MAEVCPFEIKPLAMSKVIDTGAIKNLNYTFFNLDYTSQDYWSIKERAMEIVKKNFNEDFNDFTESSLAVMLIEIWSFLTDLLSFKIDQLANEIFIDTVTEKENAFRLAKLVSFQPTPPLPARALFVASISNTISQDVILRSPVAVNVKDSGFSTFYELYATDGNNNPVFGQDIIIPAGKTFNDSIIGVEGKSYSTTVTSGGRPDQMYLLPHIKILYGSINIFIDGVKWNEVEYFSDSKPRLEYRVEYNENYEAHIIFGDDMCGLIPPEGAEIKINYRVGGGKEGNIVSGAIEYNMNVVVPGFMAPIKVLLKNYTKAQYGYDGDTIETVRRKLPSYNRTQHRAVTGGDYKVLAENFKTPYNGMISKAIAMLRNHGCAGNVIDLYVLAQDGSNNLAVANSSLKKELLEELGTKGMFTDHICVKDGNIVDVDVHIDIYIDKINKKFEENIKEKVQRRINNFFAITRWEFGQTLRETDIVKALADINEVSHFDISFTTAKGLESGMGENEIVTVAQNEIIILDNLSMAFSYKETGEI